MMEQQYGHAAGRNIQHFDHSFKAEIHTTSGNLIETAFGSCRYIYLTLNFTILNFPTKY